jgi:hypothetical protein
MNVKKELQTFVKNETDTMKYPEIASVMIDFVDVRPRLSMAKYRRAAFRMNDAIQKNDFKTLLHSEVFLNTRFFNFLQKKRPDKV